MDQESLTRTVIQLFEAEKPKPIFVAYGTVPHFEEVIQTFQAFFQEHENFLYLVPNMENESCDSPVETVFALTQQVIDALIDTIEQADENARLLSMFRMLWNLRKKIRDYSPADQLAEFVRFMEFSCSPTLHDILNRQYQSLIIAFHQFEKVMSWGNIIHNFVLEHFLDTLEGIDLRFVLFVQSEMKPNLFYGSDEESAKEGIFFYKVGTR